LSKINSYSMFYYGGNYVFNYCVVNRTGQPLTLKTDFDTIYLSEMEVSVEVKLTKLKKYKMAKETLKMYHYLFLGD